MIHHGDCLEVLKTLPPDSVDSLVTDPPAGISFMGKSWDHDKGGRLHWIGWMTLVMAECKRVMKPGAHGLVWALPRTSHWTATALEEAGFRVKDRVSHIFATGFPKSTSVSKQLEKAGNPDAAKAWEGHGSHLKPAVEDWWLIQKPLEKNLTISQNVLKWGTGAINIDSARVKPATAIQLRSSLSLSALPTVYADILESLPGSFSDICGLSLRSVRHFLHRTVSALDSDSTSDTDLWRGVVREYRSLCSEPAGAPDDYGHSAPRAIECARRCLESLGSQAGYPTLLRLCDALTRSDEERGPAYYPSLSDVLECIDPDRGSLESSRLSDSSLHLAAVWVFAWCLYSAIRRDNQSARFPANLVLSHTPYCTDEICDLECAIKALDEQSGTLKTNPGKARSAHKAGVFGVETQPGRVLSDGDSGGAHRFFYCAKISSSERNSAGPNGHPTVKSTKLMRYLIRMITPPGGTVLDPFMGSGSTGCAAKSLRFEFIGIEREAEYLEIAKKRIEHSGARL